MLRSKRPLDEQLEAADFSALPDRDRALVIMKDSRLGSYGALGLIGLLWLKATVLSALVTPLHTELGSADTSHIRTVLLAWSMMALVWCHAASRLVPVLLMTVLAMAIVGIPLFASRGGWVQGLFVMAALLKGEQLVPPAALPPLAFTEKAARNIQGAAMHDVYHAGQITLLKKLAPAD